jgi:hypothetical protein
MTDDADTDSHRIMVDFERFWQRHGLKECAELVTTLFAQFLLNTVPCDERAEALVQLNMAIARTLWEVAEDEASVQ